MAIARDTTKSISHPLNLYSQLKFESRNCKAESKDTANILIVVSSLSYNSLLLE